MEHASYGLFDDETHAQAAIDAIERSGIERRHCGVVLHKGTLDEGRLGILETGAAQGVRDGAAMGGILGAITGAILMGPLGLAAIGGAAAVGVLYGAVAGALGGSAGPDRALEALAAELKTGKILVTVEAPSLLLREQADAAMLASGGRVEHKPLF